MRARIVLGCLLVATSCDRSEPEPEPVHRSGSAPAEASGPESKSEPESPPEVPEGFVVIQGKTPLYASAQAKEASSTFGTDPETTVALEVLGHADDRVKVRTLDAQAAKIQCTEAWASAEPFELQFWIRRADAVLVTRSPVLQRFDDGTSAKLAPGVPLLPERPGSDGVHEARALGAGVRVKMAKGSVAHFYRPGSLWTPDDPVGTLPRSTSLKVGTQVISEDALRGSDAIDVFDHHKRGAGHLVTTGTRCAEMEALSPTAPDPIADDPPRPAFKSHRYAMKPALGGTPELARELMPALYTVDEGVEVRWSDGQTAGQTRARYSVTSEPRTEGDLRCFHEDELELCVAGDDLSKAEPAGILGLLAAEGESGEAIGGYGVAGLGAIGSSGTGGSALPKKGGRVKGSSAAVKGSLDKNIIRRIVRRHINEIRFCYEKALVKAPGLSGKVTVKLTIGATGEVTAATVEDDTVGDATMSKCIAKAVEGWKFPKPKGGGVVVVSYPFVLSPG